MEVIIKGEPKEIAALVLAVQGREIFVGAVTAITVKRFGKAVGENPFRELDDDDGCPFK